MNRHTPTVAFLVPIAVTWVLALVFSFSSLLEVLFMFTIGLPLLAICAVAAVVTFVFYLLGRSSGQDHAWIKVIGALSAGLVLSLVTLVPATWAAGWIVRTARQPAREALAERVISRAEQRGVTGEYEVPLENVRALLSDGGSISVYVDDEGVSVWFWDFRGILDSYSASIYVSDEMAPYPPGGVNSDYEVERESAHWWRPKSE